MADKPNIINYQTKLCAEIIQPLYDMVWDGLGETPEKNSVREFIGAVEEAPLDNTSYARRNGSWLIVPDTVISWGDIQGTLSDQVDLQAALDLKADITYVDQENAAQDADHLGLIIALG